MKRIVNLSLGAVFSVLGALSASAEPDGSTWTAEALTADTSGIRTDGYLVYAYSRNNLVINAGTEKEVPFAVLPSTSFANLDWDVSMTGEYEPLPVTDDGYRMLLKYCWPRQKPGSITLKNLISGHEYLVQIISTRGDRDTTAYWVKESGDRDLNIRAGGDGFPYGGTLVGRFVASGTTQTFNFDTVVFDADWVVFNGVQVRDLSDPETVSIETIKAELDITGTPTAAQVRTGIQAAIDRAAPSHMPVNLAAGLYEVDQQLNITNGVALIGAGMDQTIIKQAANGQPDGSYWKAQRCAKLDDGAKLQCVTLTGSHVKSNGGDSDEGAGGAVWVKNGSVSWCCISNNVSGGNSYPTAGVSFRAGQGSIDHSIICDNIVDAGNTDGIAIAVENPMGSVTIDTCLITGNHCVAGKASSGGVWVGKWNGGRFDGVCTIRNCTITDNVLPESNTYYGGGVGAYQINGSFKDLVLINNIIAGNTVNGEEKNIYAGEYIDKTASRNCVVGLDSERTYGSGASTTVIESFVVGDPGFVDAEHGNYHLNDISRAANAGVSYAGIGNDLGGVAFDNPPSIGCYEYNGDGILPEVDAETTRLTIQAAIDAAAPYHGTVHLGEGLFLIDEQLMVTNGVKLVGKGMEQTVIKQTGTASTTVNDTSKRCVTMTGGALLSRLTLTGGDTRHNSEGGAGVFVGDGDATISWCCISNNFANQFCGGGVYIGKIGSSATNPAHVKIDHTLILDNTCASIPGYSGAGIGGKCGYVQLEVDTCLICGNRNTNGNGGGIGLTASAQTNWGKSRIVNTTIVNNSASGKGGGLFIDDFDKGNGNFQSTLNETTLINCIFSDNTSGSGDPNVAFGDVLTEQWTADHSSGCCFGNGSKALGGVAFGVAGSVGFVSAANGDYRLAADSVAIDAGLKGSADGVDLAGVAYAETPSAGCYEYVGNVEAPVFTPASGVRFENSLSVELTCATPGATIRYTTDGSDPTEASDRYAMPFQLKQATRIKARAFVSGMEPSGIVTADYFGKIVPMENAARTRWTIQRAIDAAAAESPVGTVTLGEGLFEIDMELFVTNGVKLVGQGWEKTIVKQTADLAFEGRVMKVTDGSKVESMTITGGKMRRNQGGDNNNAKGGGVFVNDGTISWCCITNNIVTDGNSKVGGGVCFVGNGGQIDHSIVAYNQALTSTGAASTGGGIGCDGLNYSGVGVTIDTCLVYGNTACYSNVSGKGGGIGFVIANVNQPFVIRNSTIVDNIAGKSGQSGTSKGGGVYVETSSTTSFKFTITMVNCIVAGNMTYGADGDDVNLPVVDNVDYCLFGNATDKIGEHSVVGDPSFVDAENGDYHVTGGSPAADAGLWYSGIVADLDGSERGEPPTIGCYNGQSILGKRTIETSIKGRGTVSAPVVFLPEGVDSVKVSYAFGIDDESLGAYVELDSAAVVDDVVTASMTELNPLQEYVYSFKVEENGGEGKTYLVKGRFTTPDWPSLKLGIPKVEAYSKSADLRVAVQRLGGGTGAEIYLAWGEKGGTLGEFVRIPGTYGEKELATYTIDGLVNEKDYVYQLVASNDVGDVVRTTGKFTTLPKEKLTIGAPQVSVMTKTSAKLGIDVLTLGEGATSAKVELYWGTEPGVYTSGPVVLDEVATRGSSLSCTLGNLTENTQYYFKFVVTNDLGDKEIAEGGFITDDPAVGPGQGDYPADLGDNEGVTYDADNAGDPETLVPGKPYRVVNTNNGYTVCYHSTVGAGQDYWFRSDYDLQYNASARIGDNYYLFLSDAVDAAADGDEIELLRNNYAVGETMKIDKKLTIHGNGYTVKVAVPFLDETGYVVDNDTVTDQIVVFHIANGGDVKLDNMTVMGGGKYVDNYNYLISAIVVGKAAGGTTSRTISGSNGILEMDHVTVMRSQGGINSAEGTKVHLDACNIVRNARACGGGFYCRGLFVMENSSLSENRSLLTNGGGAACENQGALFMNNCVILNNGSTEFGGAINQIASTHIDSKQTEYLYMMNMTMSGNFTSYSTDVGGGIGIHHLDGVSHDLYMVNCILCNNYYYNTSTKNTTVSDIVSNNGNNNFLYSVYGKNVGGSTFENCVTVNAAEQDVFKGYTGSTRVYEATKTTAVAVVGPGIETAPGDKNARYAPLSDYESAGFMDTAGVYTYFDASKWREWTDDGTTGPIQMSYKTATGEMVALGECQMADEEDLVTTYYETAFAPNISDRELGVVGASGFGLYQTPVTLWLVNAPTNGSVSANLSIFGTTYNKGDIVQVIAKPDTACTFLGWYDDEDNLVYDKASWEFVIGKDTWLWAKFSPPSPTYKLNVQCEQAYSETHEHGEFPITVTTNWLAKLREKFPTELGSVISETGTFNDGDPTAVQAIEDVLNTPDSGNGLNHIWQDYVLGGLEPGDPEGRIWIRANQTMDKNTLEFECKELAKTQSCGFDVKYRLAPKVIATDADFVRGDAYQNGPKFSGEKINQDKLTHRVIDMIFIPDDYETSWEYVTTVNTAGVLKVESAKNVEILGAPWVGFSPTNNPPIEAPGYVKASCLNLWDVLYVYDQARSNYLAWAVQEDGTWKSLRTYLLVNGYVVSTDADAERTNSIPRGAGVWLERKDGTKPIYLYGQVDPSPVTTTLKSGFNLVGSPYATTFNAGSLDEPDNKASKIGEGGDHIVIPTGAVPLNCIWREGAAGWEWPSNVVTVLPNGMSITGKKYFTGGEEMTLPVGHGFWYLNSSERPLELVWPTGD